MEGKCHAHMPSVWCVEPRTCWRGWLGMARAGPPIKKAKNEKKEERLDAPTQRLHPAHRALSGGGSAAASSFFARAGVIAPTV